MVANRLPAFDCPMFSLHQWHSLSFPLSHFVNLGCSRIIFRFCHLFLTAFCCGCCCVFVILLCDYWRQQSIYLINYFYWSNETAKMNKKKKPISFGRLVSHKSTLNSKVFDWHHRYSSTCSSVSSRMRPFNSPNIQRQIALYVFRHRRRVGSTRMSFSEMFLFFFFFLS